MLLEKESVLGACGTPTHLQGLWNLSLRLCTLNSWPGPAARISSPSRGGSSAFYSTQVVFICKRAVGETSHQPDCRALLAPACLNERRSGGEAEMLAFCFQTKEAQGDIGGGTLVSETSVCSHTGQAFPSWYGVSGGSPSEVPVPGLHGLVCRRPFWWVGQAG